MHYALISFIGVTFAAIVSIAVTIEYPVLVKMRDNIGARLFFALLLSLDALIGLTFIRAFVGDFPFRVGLVTFFFYILGATIATIGVLIWKYQREGAASSRKQPPPTHTGD